MDKIQAIRFFLKLSESLSFKGTAQHFGVPPSTVSRSIKALERELGATLVDRTTRRVRLTETGEWYRDEVTGPLRALATADALVDSRSREAAGTLRITALPGYGVAVLFSALKQFRATYPHIVCDVELADRCLDLSTGEIDIALRATAHPPEYLIAKRLHAHRFVLVASAEFCDQKGRPQTVAEVQNFPALAYRSPSGIKPWLATQPNGDVVTIPTTPELITNHAQLMYRSVMEGAGIALIPTWAIAEELRTGSLVEIPLDDARPVAKMGPERSIYLLYHPQKTRLGKVRAMVDFITQSLRPLSS